jgi:uncharacterized membrane protein YphA (DoxX/SURF4 family)
MPWKDASSLDTAGRILIVGFFLAMAILNSTQAARVQDHVNRLRIFKAPFPQATFWCGILLQLTGCVLLIVDWRPDIGALCLIVFTVLATLLLRFWDVQDPMKRAGMFNGFMSNIAVLGGLLLLLHKRPLTIVPPIQTRAARQAGKRPCR